MFKKIFLHKFGLFASGSDNIIRLITFDNRDSTFQEATSIKNLMELNGQLTTIIFNPSYNNLFTCSTQGVDIYDLITMKDRTPPFIPISIGKIVDIVMINIPYELVLTIRDSGSLEAWSITDGSRKFFIDISDEND